MMGNDQVNYGTFAGWNRTQPLKLENSLESAYDVLSGKSKPSRTYGMSQLSKITHYKIKYTQTSKVIIFR